MKKAFTLIELMVVISIIAILSTIALAGFRQAQNAARDTKKIATIVGAQAALERYYSDQATAAYPTAVTWTALMTGLAGYFTNGAGDNAVAGCLNAGGTPAASCALATNPACAIVSSGAQIYTITFCKSSGGSAAYTQPQ